jgi:hypothetical protein
LIESLRLKLQWRLSYIRWVIELEDYAIVEKRQSGLKFFKLNSFWKMNATGVDIEIFLFFRFLWLKKHEQV